MRTGGCYELDRPIVDIYHGESMLDLPFLFMLLDNIFVCMSRIQELTLRQTSTSTLSHIFMIAMPAKYSGYPQPFPAPGKSFSERVFDLSI